jgi:hypothetical protein
VRRRAILITSITSITIIITTITGDLTTQQDGWPPDGAIFLCRVTKLLAANLAKRPIAAEKLWKTDALSVGGSP